MIPEKKISSTQKRPCRTQERLNSYFSPVIDGLACAVDHAFRVTFTIGQEGVVEFHPSYSKSIVDCARSR